MWSFIRHYRGWATRLTALALLLTLCVSLTPTPGGAEELIVVPDGAFDSSAGAAPETTDPPAEASEALQPEPTPFVTLARGASGEGVAQVQQRLFELGYYNGKISGNFLDGTDAAIRAFQKKNGLAQNGKVTATCWNALMSPEAIQKSGQASGGTPQPLSESFATPAPAQQNLPALDGSFVYTRTLQYGDKGDGVKQIQQRLTDLGYYNKEISGNFLGNTRNAVRAFQKNNGLPVDGVAGESTQNMLWSAELALPASAAPRPTPTPPPAPYLLTIDITNQVVTAYALGDGSYTEVARRMICSTGTKANPTPIKTIKGCNGRARWGYFPEWGSHAQYLTRIDKSNAFHSVLYSEPNSMALVVGAYNALGTRASHGCVRLLVEDAKWIYDNCPAGTTITTFEGEPDPELTEMLKPPPLNRKNMLPQETPQPTPAPVWAAAATPPAYRVMSKGSQGTDVWWLQTKLTTLGYYKGTVTGGYYGGTINAVKAFQTDAGLTVDGVAGPATLTRLYEDPAYASPSLSQTSAPQAPTDSSAPISAPARTPAPFLQAPGASTPIAAPQATPAPGQGQGVG